MINIFQILNDDEIDDEFDVKTVTSKITNDVQCGLSANENVVSMHNLYVSGSKMNGTEKHIQDFNII